MILNSLQSVVVLTVRGTIKTAGFVAPVVLKATKGVAAFGINEVAQAKSEYVTHRDNVEQDWNDMSCKIKTSHDDLMSMFNDDATVTA